MKKNVAVFMMVLLLVGSSMLGCIFHRDPKSVTVDEVEYISGFYDGMYLVGIEYREFSTSLFTRGNFHWWHLEDSTFDMYYCRHSDSLYWSPTLYCRKSQFEEVKNYYHDTDNFDYYLGIHLEDEKDVKLDEDIDRDILEKAIAVVIDMDNYSTKKYKKTTIELAGEPYIRPTIYRKSKDGLFTTGHREWIYFEENLYILNFSTPKGYNLIIIEEDVSAYMIDLLKQHDLVS